MTPKDTPHRQTKRFAGVAAWRAVPAPGQYVVRTPVYSQMQHSPSAAFKAPLPLPSAARLASYRKRVAPGPGDYGLSAAPGPRAPGQLSTSTFRSTIPRLREAPEGTLDAPPPSYYQVQEEGVLPHIPAATAAFKATGRHATESSGWEELRRSSLSRATALLGAAEVRGGEVEGARAPGPGTKTTTTPTTLSHITANHHRLMRGTAIAYKPLHEPADPDLPGPGPGPGSFEVSAADECVRKSPARTLIAPPVHKPTPGGTRSMGLYGRVSSAIGPGMCLRCVLLLLLLLLLMCAMRGVRAPIPCLIPPPSRYHDRTLHAPQPPHRLLQSPQPRQDALLPLQCQQVLDLLSGARLVLVLGARRAHSPTPAHRGNKRSEQQLPLVHPSDEGIPAQRHQGQAGSSGGQGWRGA
jgi:hypothetical protein